MGKGGSHPLLPVWAVVAKVAALSGAGPGCFIEDRTGRVMGQSKLAKEGGGGAGKWE